MKISNLKFKIFISLLLTASYLLPATSVYAGSSPLPCPTTASGGINIGDCFGYGQFTSIGQAISPLVMPGFSVAAAAVVIYFLWGAFNILKSGGNKEEMAAARGMITHAIIGFIILIFAFLILQFLLSSLFGITEFQLFQT